MRRLALASVLVLGACGTDAGVASAPPPGAAEVAADGMTADLFPTAARTADVLVSPGGPRTLRTEPAGDGAVLWLEGEGVHPQRIDVARTATGWLFSGGPESRTELIREGAAPGTRWTSGDAAVVFEGWERVALPAGPLDAARVRATSGPPEFPSTATWWFVRGRGVVRLRIDHGGAFVTEMTLAR